MQGVVQLGHNVDYFKWIFDWRILKPLMFKVITEMCVLIVATMLLNFGVGVCVLSGILCFNT